MTKNINLIRNTALIKSLSDEDILTNVKMESLKLRLIRKVALFILMEKHALN